MRSAPLGAGAASCWLPSTSRPLTKFEGVVEAVGVQDRRREMVVPGMVCRVATSARNTVVVARILEEMELRHVLTT
jgi:hypothetical protein